MSNDDRILFAQQRNVSILELGKDKEIFNKSKDLLLDLDRHRYPYIWTWLGVPIIQLPADIMALQEIIWRVKPTVIIETGVARGGSLIFSASMLQLLGQGKVLGIDIDIRDHNREEIEKSPFADRIKMFQSDSTSPNVKLFLDEEINSNDRVMVILDSNHSYDHVKKEMSLYADYVSVGQYLVVADTLLGYLTKEETPKRSSMWYPGDEPLSAINDFMIQDDRFLKDEITNSKLILSASPGGYLIRVK